MDRVLDSVFFEPFVHGRSDPYLLLIDMYLPFTASGFGKTHLINDSLRIGAEELHVSCSDDTFYSSGKKALKTHIGGNTDALHCTRTA